MGSFDLPAKALVTNMKQYNGAFSCPTCMDSGDNSLSGNCLVRYWPYQAVSVERTAHQMFEAIRKATLTGQVVHVMMLRFIFFDMSIIVITHTCYLPPFFRT